MSGFRRPAVEENRVKENAFLATKHKYPIHKNIETEINFDTLCLGCQTGGLLCSILWPSFLNFIAILGLYLLFRDKNQEIRGRFTVG